MAGARLICDVGGTNARFALVGEGGAPERVRILPVAAHATFAAALDAYLAEAGAPVAAAAIAAAGPVVEGRVRLTNAPWEIRADEIAERLGGRPVRLLNDLEAVAFALPTLGPSEVEMIAPGARPGGRPPMLAVNVGTGFGAAVAVPTTSGWTALGGEPGHMRIDPGPFGAGETSVEEVFAGPAYRRLFAAPGDPGAAAADAEERRRLYARLFGRVAGDLALATGAWGGVFFCGGVLADFAQVIAPAPFLEGFRAKGPMSERMATIPVANITLPTPAFRGLATALRQMDV